MAITDFNLDNPEGISADDVIAIRKNEKAPLPEQIGAPPAREVVGSENLKYKQGLESDYQRIVQESQDTAKNLGIVPLKDGIEPKAVRVRGQLIGQKELQDTSKALNMYLEDLMERSEFVNEGESQKERAKQLQKNRNFQIALLKQGIEFDRQISQAKVDQERKLQLFSALAGVAQGVGYAVGSGRSKGINAKKVETSVSPQYSFDERQS